MISSLLFSPTPFILRDPGQEYLSGVEGKRARLSEAATPVVWGMSLVSFLEKAVGYGTSGVIWGLERGEEG